MSKDPTAPPEDAARRSALSLPLVAVIAVLVFGGLPLAVWLDLRSLSETQLSRQANALSETIDDLRDFYAENVVARAVAHGGAIEATHRYLEQDGAIPIPATFSLELVSIFDNDGDQMEYRFVSDYPFGNRTPTILTGFERQALATLTEDPTAQPYESRGSVLTRSVSMATPVLMGQACVDCHNAHPESPRKDWEVGDVRAIQAVTLSQSLGANVFAFQFLLLYLVGLAGVAIWVFSRLRAQAAGLKEANLALGHANDFLAAVSTRVARYISPKVYRRIFTGEDTDEVRTDRRKLTIFFSDIQGFTEISERLQPEELTLLLNEYFTDMARIAEAHGGTLDKFVGDAVLVFFGDPVSRGVRDDARAALQMALAMQDRIDELAEAWRARGHDWDFAVRMGLNTGYCNVGNFGSEDRLSYTIIGAEVNLAARLQGVCRPGEIAIAIETYSYVSDLVKAEPAGPMDVKGISHPVSYHVVPSATAQIEEQVEQLDRVDRVLNDLRASFESGQLSDAERQKARQALRVALARIGGR